MEYILLASWNVVKGSKVIKQDEVTESKKCIIAKSSGYQEEGSQHKLNWCAFITCDMYKIETQEEICTNIIYMITS